MAAGKNKLTRWMRLYFNNFDLSGDARTLDKLDSFVGEVDLTGWSDSVKNYLSDLVLQTGIRGFQALLNDATGRAFTRLNSPTGLAAKRVSLLLGSGAEPVAGDLAYLLDGVDMSDQAGWDGKAAAFKADFLPVAGVAHGWPWGVVLMPLTALSNTTNGTAINNLAESLNGWHSNLHIMVSSGGVWAFTIEHSTNGSSWSTLGTFLANGGTVNSEYLAGTGTVNQYVRFVATKTSGTCTVACTFARK